MNSRLLIRGVIVDVRRLVPDVTRGQLAPHLAKHFPSDPGPIGWELDIAFGVPEGREG